MYRTEQSNKSTIQKKKEFIPQFIFHTIAKLTTYSQLVKLTYKLTILNSQ